MNERIRDIVGQSLDTAVPETYVTLSRAQLDNFSEKFAELIVKECVGIVETEANRGTEHTMDQLLSHFGVKL